MSPYREPAPPSQACPRCGLGLGARALGDASIDECSACGGTFVPRELLPRIVDPLDLGLELMNGAGGARRRLAASDGRPVACPRCRQEMARRPMVRGSGVVVDDCARHGVWFDAQELRRLAELSASMDLRLRGAATRPTDDPLLMPARVELVREPARPAERSATFISQSPSVLDGLLEGLLRRPR